MFGDENTTGDEQDWRLRQHPRRPSRRGPGRRRRRPATTGARSSPSRSSPSLILGMACVNFTNLATARASQRAREVALRKVLGANRKQLIVQFLGESMLVAALAMLLALAMVELLLPLFSGFLDADLTAQLFRRGRPAAADPRPGAAGRGRRRALPGLLSVALPAGPGAQGQQVVGRGGGLGRLRNILVVAQFAVSIGLIICTAVVYAQTVYARTRRSRLSSATA